MEKNERLTYINENLKPRGDRTFIAKERKVTRTWVSLVLSGKGVSEPILSFAEELIESRKNQSHETTNS